MRRLILRHGMMLALIGSAVGLAIAFGGVQMLKSLLYGVSATDPVTFGGVALVLLATALFACWIPVRRAARGVGRDIALRCPSGVGRSCAHAALCA